LTYNAIQKPDLCIVDMLVTYLLRSCNQRSWQAVC